MALMLPFLSNRLFENVLAVNRALLAPMDVSPAEDPAAEPAADPVASAVEDIEAGENLPGWQVDQPDADTAAALGVGDSVSFSKLLTDEDVRRFAAASGDTNPLHLDEDEAAETRFGGRIVHGTLVSGLISAALARLPGTIVYLSQDLEFQAPVEIDDRATATCEIVEDLGDGRYRLSTTVGDDDRDAIVGEAVVLIEDA